MDIGDYLSKVEDPRVVSRCKHKLSDILVIVLVGYLFGSEWYELMCALLRMRRLSLQKCPKNVYCLTFGDTSTCRACKDHFAPNLNSLRKFALAIWGDTKTNYPYAKEVIQSCLEYRLP